ncbi:MAG: TOBE domain-containing protein [archaeon]
MSNNDNHKVSCKIWLEYRGQPLLGKGGAKILETIKQVESISVAAKKAGMSYRYVWNYLSKLQRRLGEPVVITYKGGNKGGGGAKLTDLGAKLIDEYKQAEAYMKKNIGTQALTDDNNSKNRLKGTVYSIGERAKTSNVTVTLKTPANLTISVTKKSVEALNLKPNDDIEALIKASDITIAKVDANKD